MTARLSGFLQELFLNFLIESLRLSLFTISEFSYFIFRRFRNKYFCQKWVYHSMKFLNTFERRFIKRI